MKLKIMYVLLLSIFSAATITKAQEMKMKKSMDDPKMLVVLNKADWCHVCKENGARVTKDIAPMIEKNQNVKLLINDLSNKKTKMSSNKVLDEYGLNDFTKDNKGTGVMYFVNPKNHKVLGSTSVAEPNDKILMAYGNALKMTKMPMHGEKGHVCNESCMTH